MRKSAHLFNLLLVFALAGWLGLPIIFAEESKEADPQKAEEPAKKVVGIIPVQKSVPSPLYLSTEPTFFDTVKQMFEEKDARLKKRVNYDPRFVPEVLEENLTQRILRHGYLVYTPEQIAPQFHQLTLFREEFPIEELSQYFEADAFLMVTFTEWDAQNYDRSGTVKVGFQAVLVDSQTKKVVWSNQAAGLKLKTPSGDFLYSKYQRDVLNELAGRVLKGFPKNDWIVNS